MILYYLLIGSIFLSTKCCVQIKIRHCIYPNLKLITMDKPLGKNGCLGCLLKYLSLSTVPDVYYL